MEFVSLSPPVMGDVPHCPPLIPTAPPLVSTSIQTRNTLLGEVQVEDKPRYLTHQVAKNAQNQHPSGDQVVTSGD